MAEEQEFWTEGTCLCGACVVKSTGKPMWVAMCHCNDCRRATGAVFMTTGWAVNQITLDKTKLDFFKNSEDAPSNRGFCKECRAHVATCLPGDTMIGIPAAITCGQKGNHMKKFEPQFHGHYGKRVLDVADDKPKYADFPAELGGSGELCTT